MTSYDLGDILGRVQASKWKRANKSLASINPSNAANSCFDMNFFIFKKISKDDFVIGFIDGVEAIYKGELLEVAV